MNLDKKEIKSVVEVKKVKTHAISELLKQPVDVFICSGSFEERCKTIPSQIQEDEAKYVLICENEDLAEVVRPNSKYLADRFGSKSIHVPLRTDNPFIGADKLMSTLKEICKCQPKHFLIDITTFTHESLLILLKIVRQLLLGRNDISIQFAYTGAKDYSVGEKQQDKWLSKGVGEIRSVLGYSGRVIPSHKMHLIVLLGFETERAMKLIDGYEPSVTSVGFGEVKGSISPQHHKVNVGFYDLLKEVYTNIHEFQFSCVEPLLTMRMVQNQVEKFPGHNVVLAPMNNKISTIGAALSAITNDSIQVCYAHANQYNYEGYSTPGEWAYIFDLPELLHEPMAF